MAAMANTREIWERKLVSPRGRKERASDGLSRKLSLFRRTDFVRKRYQMAKTAVRTCPSTVAPNPQFSCIATTNFGGIAIGSKDGNVRLYKEVGKKAKSLVSGFGDPIRAIDTTADGRYVLATCDKYLLVITTTCKGSSNGFVDQLGKEKKSPKSLKIKPVDIAKYEIGRAHV